MDIVRVAAEDRRQVQTEIGGVRYTARGGYFQMPETHAKLHREAGNLPSSAPAAGPLGRRVGYRCPACGFGSVFITCSRCGGACKREQ